VVAEDFLAEWDESVEKWCPYLHENKSRLDKSLAHLSCERIFGIPRLVEQTKGTVLTLKLVQTYLPAARTEFSVEDFNQLAFCLHFTYTLWESSCDAMNEYHFCVTAELAHEFCSSMEMRQHSHQCQKHGLGMTNGHLHVIQLTVCAEIG